MNNYIPKDVEQLLKDLVALDDKDKEFEEDVLERLYLEIMPEEESADDVEEESSNIITIQL